MPENASIQQLCTTFNGADGRNSEVVIAYPIALPGTPLGDEYKARIQQSGRQFQIVFYREYEGKEYPIFAMYAPGYNIERAKVNAAQKRQSATSNGRLGKGFSRPGTAEVIEEKRVQKRQ
jgi:hypothetical protein